MSIKAWKDISWALVEERISRLQKRIFRASLERNNEKLKYLQLKLINSLDAKLLSVQRVTEKNRGRKTPGIDGKIITSPCIKLELAKKLKLNGEADPIRRTYIPKPGKMEKRPLGIPTIEDRAKQMLAKLALEPEWEAKFEPNSYGFRPGRSAHDAIASIYSQLRGTSKYIIDADIEKCFDQIDHQKLLKKLNTIAILERQIQSWLKASIMEGYKTQNVTAMESSMGTPQGGIISPLLANIALHGLEESIKNYYTQNLYQGSTKKGIRDRRKEIGITRYADDLVITCPSLEIAEKAKEYLNAWLTKEIGLRLSENKTKIVNSTEGFDFLGFTMISLNKENQKIFRTRPSRKSKEQLLAKTRNILTTNRAISSGMLIEKLSPIIVGWCNYFKYSDCVADFKQVEYAIFGQIRAWVFRRQSKGLNSRTSIKEKYFPNNTTVTFNGIKHTGNWILTGIIPSRNPKTPKNVFLPYPSWIKSERYVKVRKSSSPFDNNNIYWSSRNQKYGPFSLRVKKLLKRQAGSCAICKIQFKNEDKMEIDHIIPIMEKGKDIYSNLQLLHRHCHAIKTQIEISRSRN